MKLESIEQRKAASKPELQGHLPGGGSGAAHEVRWQRRSAMMSLLAACLSATDQVNSEARVQGFDRNCSCDQNVFSL